MIIVIICMIALGIYALQSRMYLKKSFDNVFVEVRFKDTGVFEGDRTELIETVGNKKWLALWWLIIRLAVSKNIKFDSDIENLEEKGDCSYRRDLYSLGSYQKSTRFYGLTAARRGYYHIETAALSTGDLFGDNRFLMEVPVNTQLYVYPAPINTGELQVPFERLMGEILSRRRLIEDPFQIRGIRDYSQFDSFKRINWNATARTAHLKVNEYDFTSSQEVVVFLNVERFNDWDGDGTIEESIRIAASIASECVSGGIPVGIVSNGKHCLTGEKVKIETSNNPGHSEAIYQQLACLSTRDLSGPFAEIMAEEALNRNLQPLYVLISQYFGPDIQQEVERFRRDGFNLYWILPKYRDTVLKVENMDNLYVWDVTYK